MVSQQKILDGIISQYYPQLSLQEKQEKKLEMLKEKQKTEINNQGQ